jgi:midasin
MKQGHWIVLDELNLASQSVLEGLNACLDHRGEVYIPEIGRSFAIPPGQFRLFACQNPVHQGGGRKGLPKSFLNRFTQVQVGSLNVADMTIIVKARYPMLAAAILEAIVGFNMDVHALTQHLTSVGNDVNLRDVFRWCDLLVVNQNDNTKEPRFYAATVYASRVQYIPESQWLRLLNERFSTIGSIQAGATNPKPSVVDSTDILDLLDLTLPLPQPSWERFSSAGLILREGELLCGPAVLPRNPFTRGRTTGSSPWYTLQPTITLIPSQYDGLSQIALGLSQAWMVNVVGRHGCGKTKAVQTLAALCQQELAVFSMNSSVDTMELLGGFEQIDLSQERNELMESLQDAVAVTLQLLVYQRSNELIAAWSNICDHLAALLQRNGYHQTEGSSHDTTIDYARLHSLVGQLQSCCSSCDETENQTEALRLLSKLAAAAQLLQSSEMTKKTGAFEWRDGPLITAMKKGQWLLIDNVNFCSPAVLDRLNGLLEPNGCLFVNERGVIDGEVRVSRADFDCFNLTAQRLDSQDIAPSQL